MQLVAAGELGRSWEILSARKCAFGLKAALPAADLGSSPQASLPEARCYPKSSAYGQSPCCSSSAAGGLLHPQSCGGHCGTWSEAAQLLPCTATATTYHPPPTTHRPPPAVASPNSRQPLPVPPLLPRQCRRQKLGFIAGVLAPPHALQRLIRTHCSTADATHVPSSCCTLALSL